MKIEILRKHAGREEIEYQFILSELKDYANPRNHITQWLKSGELIRVKKGLYVFGPMAAHQPYSKEVLANLVYGPSAISMTYALSYYGLIPERVKIITSITNNRNKSFSTCVGDFKYTYLPSHKFSIGLTLNTQHPQQTFLIASPEKALCDQIYLVDKNVSIENEMNLENYLLNDLRIDEKSLLKFKLSRLQEVCDTYNDSRLFSLHHYIKSRK